MIVICEECGKKYHLKTAMIQHDAAWITCKTCRHRFAVRRPAGPSHGADGSADAPPEAIGEDELLEVIGEDELMQVAPEPPDRPKGAGQGRRLGFPLQFALFLLAPVALLYGAGTAYSLYAVGRLQQRVASEISDAVEQVVKRDQRLLAQQAALAIGDHLRHRPGLQRESFNRDALFTEAALRRIGTTGQTFVFERPGPDGTWRIWAHPDDTLVGIDMGRFRDVLGADFADFWSVLTGVQQGGVSEGFHAWVTAEGQKRRYYTVAAPVTGTPFVVAATAEAAELFGPAAAAASKANGIAKRTRRMVAAALLTGLVAIGALTLFYGRRLAGRIHRLAGVAE